MRIISGKYRGKRIKAPRNIKARPTTDFAKESLFNILQNRFDMDGLIVLDLFSGTGNIAYEFASRGAEMVMAVDIAQASFSFIRRTSTEMDVPIWAVKADSFRFLGGPQAHTKFDVIFADPPYDLPKMKDIPSAVFNNDHLKPGGLLIVEHDDNTSFEEHPNFVEQRGYGKVQFSFFEPDQQ